MRMFVTTTAAIVAATTRPASTPSTSWRRPTARRRPGAGSGGAGGGDGAAPGASGRESSVVESRAVRPRPSIIAPTVPRPFDSRLLAFPSGRFGRFGGNRFGDQRYFAPYEEGCYSCSPTGGRRRT
jgi:hypothetical protein